MYPSWIPFYSALVHLCRYFVESLKNSYPGAFYARAWVYFMTTLLCRDLFSLTIFGLLYTPGKFDASMLRGVFQKKKRYFLGIFPKRGGRGSPHSQNFCVITIAIKTPLRHLKIPQKPPKNFQLDQKKR